MTTKKEKKKFSIGANELSEVVYLHPDQGPLAKMTLLQNEEAALRERQYTNTTERTEV